MKMKLLRPHKRECKIMGIYVYIWTTFRRKFIHIPRINYYSIEESSYSHRSFPVRVSRRKFKRELNKLT